MIVEWFIVELADMKNIMSLVTSVSVHQIMKEHNKSYAIMLEHQTNALIAILYWKT